MSFATSFLAECDSGPVRAVCHARRESRTIFPHRRIGRCMNSGVASRIVMALLAMLLVISVAKLDHAEAQAVFKCDGGGMAEVQ